MKVTILTSSTEHPAFNALMNWCSMHGQTMALDHRHLAGGDLMVAVSYGEKVPAEVRAKYAKSCVIHESSLPEGRGWSPWAWQIMEGKEDIPISMIEMADEIDAGGVLLWTSCKIGKTQLYQEIHDALVRAKLSLIDLAVKHGLPEPVPQSGEPSYYERLTPEDSQIDITRSIGSQFNRIRICDPRFPAFFYYGGVKFNLTVEKA